MATVGDATGLVGGAVMTFFVQMLFHTPPYVFVLFAYIVWQGTQSLRSRRRAIWRLLIVPTAFTATGLLLLALRPFGGFLPIAAWLGGLVAFVPLGLATGPRIVGVDRAGGLVMLGGSPVPLLRNLLVFSAQYAIAVVSFLHPQAQASFVVAGHLVSGTSIGYFIGWTIMLRHRYRGTGEMGGEGLFTGVQG